MNNPSGIYYMNTLEAIQFLLDNPDEIIREKDSNALICYVKVTKGAVMTCDENGNFLCLFTLDKAKLKSHWEVVKKPPKQVGFMEAVNSGKYIRPVEDIKFTFKMPEYWLLSYPLPLGRVNGLWEIEN